MIQGRKKYVLLICMIFLFSTGSVLADDNNQKVKVGVFQFAPLVYIDDKGIPQGVFVDVIEEIAKSEGWTVEYSIGSWNDGLEKVKKGQIDLMTSVMHLPRRESFLDFTRESVFNIWGQIYIHKDSRISGIFDIRGKSVGVLKGGANGENFIKLLEKLDIKCDVLPFDSLKEIAIAVSDNNADAGVFPNIHGYSYQQSHQLKQTQIVFDPSFLKYATTEGSNKRMLAAIDRHLEKWKDDQQSPYYNIIDRHLGLAEEKQIPRWVWTFIFVGTGMLGITIVASLILAVFNKNLQRKVALATKDLEDHARKLEKINEDLKTRNKELDEFTYVASHDLQEPLRKITAFSSLLQMDLGDDLSEDAQENLDFLTDAAVRMQTLVNDLLTLSRSGRREMIKEKVSLGECIDSALASLDMLMNETNTKIVRDDLPEIYGDKTIISQLFQNLINNAIKFNNGNPVVRITAEKTDDGLVLGVCDNGIGIAQQYQEQIFAPFKRLHGKGVYSGTGIGLAICRKAVERHNGKIWVESELGKGSHFKFTLSQNGGIEK